MAFDDTKSTFDTITATEWNNMITYIKTIIRDSSQLSYGVSTELTITSGAVTKTQSYHTIDTEGDAASDDLDTISGGSTGDIIVITANNTARTVVCKDGTGNLKLSGDFSLDNTEDTIQLIYDGTNWLELSRSNNGA